MNWKRILQTVLFGLAFVGTSAADDHSLQSPDALAREAAPGNKRSLYNTLKIKRPHQGQQFQNKNIGAILLVGNGIDTSTLKVYLNGDSVASDFQKERCTQNTCEITVKLTTENGLRRGTNKIRVAAYGFDKHIESKRASFDYTHGLRGTANVPMWLPPAVGLSLNPGGAQPWVSITTGTPASLVDQIDQTTYSIPYPDATFPPSGNACTTPLQVVVLSRTNPLQMVPGSYQCVSTQTQLASYLATLTNSELAIVGTTPGNNAPAGLDTSSIGGTSYSTFAANVYPQSYAIIGVPGAGAGTAFENYSIVSAPSTPFQAPAFASGLLTLIENGNYDFHPSGNVLYNVTPGASAAATSVVIGSQTYTAPAGSENGFWLLQLDGMMLQPIDSAANTSPGANCPANAETTNLCGTFYPTGSTDSTTSANAVTALASAMMSVNPRNLAFLTTVGQPFQNATAVTTALGQAFSRLGGVRYTLPSLITPTSTYTLIAAGATSDRSPLDKTVVNSSSAYSQQNQTGCVNGVLARTLNSLYLSTVATQTDGKMNAQGAVSMSPDLAIYQIATTSPQHWPLTDTSGHIAAYHWISQWLINANYNFGPPYNQDLRYYYSSDTDVWNNNAQLDCSSSKCPEYPSNPVPYFSQDDFNLALSTLHTELTSLRDAHDYLGENGLRQEVDGTLASIPTAMIAATYTVQDGQFGSNSNTRVKMNTATWMNLAAGLLALPGAALGPLDLPIAAAAVGVLSGSLWSGSAIDTPFSSNPATPPSYENTFDTTLGQLSDNAATYGANLLNSYDSALDTIYHDPGKLNAVFNKIYDSADTGWEFTSNIQRDGIESVFGNGVSRTLYLQLMPQFYELDTYNAQPISDISDLGMFYQTYDPEIGVYFNTCNASPRPQPGGYGIYITAQSNPLKHDIYVIGGTINNQGKQNVSESLPSASLLDAMFETSGNPNLNFPMDPFYSNNQTTGGYMTYRSGPNQGFGQCYKPGCSDSTYDGSSSCIGP